MNDPLERYPAMMTIRDLADFLGIGYCKARLLMQQLPSVDIGFSKNYGTLRISKEYVRRKYIMDSINQLIDVQQINANKELKMEGEQEQSSCELAKDMKE
jgi:hypothetical protein